MTMMITKNRQIFTSFVHLKDKMLSASGSSSFWSHVTPDGLRHQTAVISPHSVITMWAPGPHFYEHWRHQLWGTGARDPPPPISSVFSVHSGTAQSLRATFNVRFSVCIDNSCFSVQWRLHEHDSCSAFYFVLFFCATNYVHLVQCTLSHQILATPLFMRKFTPIQTCTPIMHIATNTAAAYWTETPSTATNWVHAAYIGLQAYTAIEVRHACLCNITIQHN